MTLSKPLKIFLVLLVVLFAIGAIGYAVTVHTGHHGVIMLDGVDVSDSFLGWMIAVPIVFLTILFVAAVMAGVGVLLAAVFAMVLVMFAVLAVFGLALVALPMAAFLAVPLLAVWVVVRIAKKRNAPAMANA